MSRAIKLLLFCLTLLSAFPGAVLAEMVCGRVVDSATHQPLPLAYVMIKGQSSGSTVSAAGEFSLQLPTSVHSAYLLVFCEGYENGYILATASARLEIRLEKEMVIHESVTVTAASGMSDQPKQTTVLKKMDIYTIPGTAGDPLLTATLLPGVNAAADTSDLLIRGGAPDEVAYYFDGMEILHPFLSESAQASYFSIFDTQFIKRFNVVNSGFDGKFGNALSGIVDLQSIDEAKNNSGGIGLSLMGGQGLFTWPLGQSAGLLFSGKYDFSELLDSVNGHSSSHFQNTNSMGTFYWKSGNYSQLKLTWLMDIYRYSDEPQIQLQMVNKLLGLSYATIIGTSIYSKLTAAVGTYQNNMNFESSNFAMKLSDSSAQLRLDNIYSHGRHDVNFGFDFLRRDDSVLLSSPTGESTAVGSRFGFYGSDNIQVISAIVIHPTLRINLLRIGGHSLSTIDPALSFSISLDKQRSLRAALGLYHQFGDNFSYTKQPLLGPKQAWHLSLAYDYMGEKLQYRVSLYTKEYRHLFLNEEITTNNGSGFARGAEFFLKRSGTHFDFMLVYNFLASRRQEGDILQMADSSYEIPHSLTTVFSWKYKKSQIGLRASYTSGRPYTPLLATTFLPESQIYLPEYGDPNTLRLSPYTRIDLNFSQRLSVKNQMVVIYLGIVNLLDRQNIQSYEFNPGSGNLEMVRSIFQRSFFAGLYIPF